MTAKTRPVQADQTTLLRSTLRPHPGTGSCFSNMTGTVVALLVESPRALRPLNLNNLGVSCGLFFRFQLSHGAEVEAAAAVEAGAGAAAGHGSAALRARLESSRCRPSAN